LPLALGATCGAASAAPQGMLNKTVKVSFEISVPARNSAGQSIGARRSVQKLMYVSTAGRVFVRNARQGGGSVATNEIAPGAVDGAPRIVGDTIVGTLGLISGATRLVVSFDGSFSSCTASLIVGGESGRAITWKSVRGDVLTATGPMVVSTPSCSVQSGNAFAGS
jgi:hypothetical protein